MKVRPKAGLGYGEEVQWSVKDFYSKTRLWVAAVGMADKMEKNI